MNDVIRLTVQASPIAQAILVILLIFSIISWAVIIDRAWILRKVSSESKRFLYFFRHAGDWEAVYQKSFQYKLSPFAQVFKTAYREIFAGNNMPIQQNMALQPVWQPEKQVQSPPTNHRLSRPELLEALQAAAAAEMAPLEKSLIFLATTASASPFLGLFGTVWGVMSAFLSIGYKGSAELSVVGPGIAEALVTTAAGLAVAVPALIAYNYFVDRLRRLDNKLHQFSTELIQTKELQKAS